LAVRAATMAAPRRPDRRHDRSGLEMAFENTGRVWNLDSLEAHLATLTPPAWCNAVTLHHTAVPNLAQRPAGFTAQHLGNIAHYYRVTKGWRSAPHLFVDEDQLWGMCDFRRKGVHAVSFNARAIGIEVLGNYDVENPSSGRGLACWQTAAGATKLLLDWLGRPIGPDTVLFHRDDPRTSKSCPGRLVTKERVLQLIAEPRTKAPPPASASEPPRPSVALPSEALRFDGARWVVPARDFLRAKGVAEEEIRRRLKKRGRFFYFGDELLEDAYYDEVGRTTWVALSELEGLAVAAG
jgi:hypothetical protein